MLRKLPTSETNTPRGLEKMAKHMNQTFFPSLGIAQKYNWITTPSEYSKEDVDLARTNKNIVWIHTIYYGYPPYPSIDSLPDTYIWWLRDKKVVENTDYYLVQSTFHKINVVKNLKLPREKVIVVNNGFNPIPYMEKPKGKIRLIYTPSFDRGAVTLIEAFRKVRDKDLELLIHLSCECPDCLTVDTKKLIAEDSRIIIKPYAKGRDYIDSLQSAHLMVYPCDIEETSCISVMEAMSAGIKVVTSNTGALPDTTMGYAKLVDYEPNAIEIDPTTRKKYAKIFAKEIRIAVKELRKDKFDPLPQIEAINNRFGWESIEKKWVELDKKLS